MGLILDNFGKCIEIVSNMVENDWMKLYYKLPFYPERGAENIKKDIDDVYSQLYRGDVLKVVENFFFINTKRLEKCIKLFFCFFIH